MFDGRFRAGVDRVTQPVGSALRRTGLSPDQFTALGLLMAIPATWAIATGRLGCSVRVSPNHFEDPLNRPCNAPIKWAGEPDSSV